MEDAFIENSVRTRLIVAGINEIEERGIKDFSLRRAALAAEVSCAAPYRHFKDKEDFISEIIKYVGSKWELLCREIVGVFKNDKKRLVIELAVSNLRVWVANPNYRSVLLTLSAAGKEGLSVFDAPLLSAIDEYALEKDIDLEKTKHLVRALIYGSLMLAGEDSDTSGIVSSLRERLEKEFE